MCMYLHTHTHAYVDAMMHSCLTCSVAVHCCRGSFFSNHTLTDAHTHTHTYTHKYTQTHVQTVWCVAARTHTCSTLQCAAVCCNVLQYGVH